MGNTLIDKNIGMFNLSKSSKFLKSLLITGYTSCKLS
ncbi:hypothetical protein N473_08805 [Pseudoalteromonas luteoviolacea CPMOR-1]|uniref:Uncharacterized protein n=1 Tax=Pseudoalteromonas luteoviolacea CPMOR-1 TaxID=1365248 RepID=A0A167MIU3_9GAMM|nr:hypothetical protein N473_08805 [Pseudoalteromonas luteoviolacea CPMOR-1]